jgi:hypothetical protein
MPSQVWLADLLCSGSSLKQAAERLGITLVSAEADFSKDRHAPSGGAC